PARKTGAHAKGPGLPLCTTTRLRQDWRPGRRRFGRKLALAPGGQGSDEGLLRHRDGTDVLHALLTFLLLLQQLALTRNVTAVTLGEDVLAQRADVLTRDDLRADGSLDRHLELLARDQVL